MASVSFINIGEFRYLLISLPDLLASTGPAGVLVGVLKSLFLMLHLDSRLTLCRILTSSDFKKEFSQLRLLLPVNV